MPLGDSITQDGGNGSYRQYLYTDLNANTSFVWDFVGSQTDTYAPVPDKNHEGHTGFWNDNLAAQADTWVATYQPDIVLVHSGTNDMLNGRDATFATGTLTNLINAIYAGKSDVHVVVAAIIDCYASSAVHTEAYQAAIPAVVTNFQNQGKSIALCDMSNTVLQSDLQSDGTHLLNSAKQKMALAWAPVVKAWAATL